MAADVLQLYDGTTTLNLLAATDYRARALQSWPVPPPEITWAGAHYRDGQFPAFSHRSNRQIVIPCTIEGTSANNLYSNLNAAALMINESTRYWTSGGTQGKRAYLRWTPDSATHQVQFEVFAGTVDTGALPRPGLRSGATAVLPAGVITLTCSPWAEPTSDNNYGSGGLANNGPTITTIAVPGETETPIGLITSPNQTLTTTPRMIAARRTRGTVANFKHLLQGETGAFTGYTGTDIVGAGGTYSEQADATCSNGKFGRWNMSTSTATRILRVAITANHADQFGQHRLMMRSRVDAGSPTFTFIPYYGVQTTPTLAAASTAIAMSTSWGLRDLGVIEWPGVAVPGDVAVSTLVFELSVAGANGRLLDIDYFRLFPLEESYLDLTAGGTITAGYKVHANGRSWPPARYVTDGSNNLLGTALTQRGSYLKMAPGVNLWVLYHNDAAADVVADTSEWTLNLRERFSVARGA